jgi:hypothetical protein
MSDIIVSCTADMVFTEYQLWFLHEYRVWLPHACRLSVSNEGQRELSRVQHIWFPMNIRSGSFMSIGYAWLMSIGNDFLMNVS